MAGIRTGPSDGDNDLVRVGTNNSLLSDDSSLGTGATGSRNRWNNGTAPTVLPTDDLLDDPNDSKMSSRLSPTLRHAVGWTLLAATVLMWTISNFLSSYMFADHTYNKPFFVTYCNTAIFIVFIPLILGPKAIKNPEEMRQWKYDFHQWIESLTLTRLFRQRRIPNHSSLGHVDDIGGSGYLDSPRSGIRRLSADGADQPLIGDATSKALDAMHNPNMKPLTVAQTARLGYRFCWLWFAANFTVATCFEYTSVASGTVLTSLSAVFTLLFGTFMGVEAFTVPKLMGVVLSFFGIFLVYATDLFGYNNDDKHRGDFPQKSFTETLTGDILALVSAAFYGYYACQIKRDCGDESRINMLLFFGFVGLFNALLLWPFFILFHLIGLEPFQLPPNSGVLVMVVSNALISGISDMFWAAAVLMLSPLMVTVGLSFSIPVSLLMQLILRHQTPSWLGGVGSAIVLASVLIVESDQTIQQWYHRVRRYWADNATKRGVP